MHVHSYTIKNTIGANNATPVSGYGGNAPNGETSYTGGNQPHNNIPPTISSRIFKLVAKI